MPKYAPKREDGMKPYVVTLTEWGRSTDRIVYAQDTIEAKWLRKGRNLYATARARRATPEDMETLS